MKGRNRTYANRRAKGLCGGCGGPPDKGMATCSTCRESTRVWSNARQEKRRLAKACQRCGTDENVRLRGGRNKRLNPRRKRHYICQRCEELQVAAVKKSYLLHRKRYVQNASQPYKPYGRRTG